MSSHVICLKRNAPICPPVCTCLGNTFNPLGKSSNCFRRPLNREPPFAWCQGLQMMYRHRLDDCLDSIVQTHCGERFLGLRYVLRCGPYVFVFACHWGNCWPLIWTMPIPFQHSMSSPAFETLLLHSQTNGATPCPLGICLFHDNVIELLIFQHFLKRENLRDVRRSRLFRVAQCGNGTRCWISGKWRMMHPDMPYPKQANKHMSSNQGNCSCFFMVQKIVCPSYF